MFLSVRTEWNEIFILIGVRQGAIWLQMLCLSALSFMAEPEREMKYSITQSFHLKAHFPNGFSYAKCCKYSPN